MSNRNLIELRLRLAAPPCPAWCQARALYPNDPAHSYDVVPYDEGEYVRCHVIRSGEIEIVQTEHNRNGLVALEPMRIIIEDEELTAAETRVRAAALLNAADLLEEIERGRVR